MKKRIAAGLTALVLALTAFCTRNQIAPRMGSRIQLAFEEVSQLLISAPESPRIRASCEYSEAENSAVWTICYDGPPNDITASGSGLGLSVLKGITEEVQYAWNTGEEYPNRLKITIRI